MATRRWPPSACRDQSLDEAKKSSSAPRSSDDEKVNRHGELLYQWIGWNNREHVQETPGFHMSSP